MKYNNLKAIWKNEEQKAFSGWDFSQLEGRWHSEPLPWDYKESFAPPYSLPISCWIWEPAAESSY